MQLDSKKTNQILIVLAIIIVVAAAIACFFLNEVQRYIVIIGAALAIINLFGLRYFFNKNMNRRR